MRAVAGEAHVVQLDDDVHVLSRDGVDGDLGWVRHRLLPVRAQEADLHRMCADLEREVAQGREPDLGGHEERRVTKFTRRSGTKIVLAGFWPSSAAFTFGLAMASFSA